MSPLGAMPGPCYLARILERGVTFLLERQSADGLWHDFLTLAGEGADWPTGVVAAELAPVASEREPLERAADSLLAAQHDDGGWGYHSGVPTDADSTACALLLLAALGRRGSQVERAAACLARHQDGDSGGLATYREPGPIRGFMGLGADTDLGGWCASHLEVTATAGRAFAAVAGGARSQAAEACWRYVSSRQRPDGSWASYWWTSHHYPTLQAVALAGAVRVSAVRAAAVYVDAMHADAVHADAVRAGAAIERAADWALREQDRDGGWPAPGAPTSAFATALSLAILLRAGLSGPAVDRAVERLGELQDADGGWPSHPIMRIPPPDLAEPSDRRAWRLDGLGTGVVVRDQHRTFTTAVCVGALALARGRSA